MVNYKGCQIVLLGDNLGRYAVKSKIYKNAYVAFSGSFGFSSYEYCKKVLRECDGNFQTLEQNAPYFYSRLNGEIIPSNKLEQISKKEDKE